MIFFTAVGLACSAVLFVTGLVFWVVALCEYTDKRHA